MQRYTCLNCNVQFKDADLQKEHYKSDWHRYNLKRRVAELPPVTAIDFQKKIEQLKVADETASQETKLYCVPCRKHYGNEKAHENHLHSKKHKDAELKFKSNPEGSSEEITIVNTINSQDHKSGATIEDCEEPNDDSGSSFEMISSDEWDDETENPIELNNCMFCDHHSASLEKNLRHMCTTHSFFVPDLEYLMDMEGLLMYLAEKITKDFICIWCNDRGKTFYTLDAVRKHMIDKGHCKMLHEGLALAEYAEFYDYSSSYPDHVSTEMDVDEELEPPPILEGDEYQLVLPSGAVIGHRSLLRYYKQRLNPNRSLATVPSKSNRRLHKVLSQYRALGWSDTEQLSAAKRARDIHHMKRQYQKWTLKLGVNANKLQKHFRVQCNF